METENKLPRGHTDGAYVACQIMKDLCASPYNAKKSTPIVAAGLQKLFENRFDLHYQSHPNSENKKLHKLLQVDPILIEKCRWMGLPHEYRKGLMNLIANPDYSNKGGYEVTSDMSPIAIPDLNENYTSGILTDILLETRSELKEKKALFQFVDYDISKEERDKFKDKNGQGIYQKGSLKYFENGQCCPRVTDDHITAEQLEIMFLDRQIAGLFIAGSCLPYLKEGTEAAARIPKMIKYCL